MDELKHFQKQNLTTDPKDTGLKIGDEVTWVKSIPQN